VTLDAARIATLLETRKFGRSLDVRESTGSTNDDARDAAGVPDGHVILADHQSAGRGSRGRAWSSPAGTDLYFSIVLLSTGLEPAALPPLTLAVGLGVALGSEPFTGQALGIKWPNDVRAGDHKCAGILVESVSVGSRLSRVVIGIGIDVNRDDFGDLDPIATSLSKVAGHPLDRERVFASVLASVEEETDRFIERGPTAIVPRVEERLVWRGRNVACNGVRGVLGGLRPDGALLIGGTPVLSGTLGLEPV